MKKGQVTIFIIIGIVILIGIILIVVFNNNESSKISFDTSIKSLIDLCVEEVSEESVYFIGLQGGYYNNQVFSESYSSFKVPYYWYEESAKVPEISVVEEEFSNYINDNVKLCVDLKLDSFGKSGYDVKTGDIETGVKISDTKLEVNINYPITISKGEEVVIYEVFKTEINTFFKSAYDSAVMMIEKQKEFPDSLPLGSFGEIAEENGFEIDLVKIEEGTFLINLVFNKNSKEGFIYAFINQYDWEVENN